MSEIFAVYLFAIFGLVLILVSFYLKWSLMFIASGICWAMVGVFCLTNQDQGNMVWAFGWFGVLMAIFSFISVIYARTKHVDVDTSSTSNEYDDIIDQDALDAREKLKQARMREPYDKSKYQ